MLTRLVIKRFKSIREQTIEFGQVNLFIGGNGTGKSNFLEAIGLASACLSRGLGDSDLGSKGLRLTAPELMKSSFKNEALPKTLSLMASFSGDTTYNAELQSRESDPLLRFFSESARMGTTKIFGRSGRGARTAGLSHPDRLEPHRGIWDQLKATSDTPESVAKEFLQFSRYAIYTPQPDFLRGRQSGKIDIPPVGLRGEGLPEAVSSFLAELNRQRQPARRGASTAARKIITSCADLVWIPGWASEFGVRQAKQSLISRDIVDRLGQTVFFIDRFMHSSRNRLSAYDSSEGTLFLLFAAVILSHPDAPKTFAFDNVDSALNPRLTRKLVEQIIDVCRLSSQYDIKDGARQVFLTSHNPTALDAFDLFDDSTRVFVVTRSEKGHTVANRLVPPNGMLRSEWETVMGGKNLSQLWLDGEIPGALGQL